MTFDGAEFGREIVAAVKGHVDRAVAPLLARIDGLERRLGEMPAPKDGRDGRDADQAAIEARIAAEVAARVAAEVGRAVTSAVAEAIAAIPLPRDGRDGRDVDQAAVEARISEEVAKLGERVSADLAEAVSEIPAPKDGRDGRDADPEEVARLVTESVAAAVAALPPPPAGKSVDMAEVEALVKAAVEALPPPRDGEPGRSVTPEELAPLVAEEVRRAVAALPAPKDGVGLAGALIDRDGALVLTLTDGSVKSLGLVVGRDADPAAVADLVQAEVAKLPVPKDGRDGFGFEDLAVEHDGERGITLRFARGAEVKEFGLSLPVVLDRGVWREGSSYQKGDAVTWGGSLWIAQQDGAVDKPDAGGPAWRLAVKRGRDGKDGTMVTRTPAGPVKGAGL